MDQKGSNRIEGIHRAFLIIRTISEFNKQGLRLSEISRKTGLHVATTRRLLLALIDEEGVIFDPVTKSYFLGPQIYKFYPLNEYNRLGGRYFNILKMLAEMTGNTAYLACRVGYDVVCTDIVEGNNAIRVVYQLGDRWPIGMGASGLAILRSLPVDEAEEIIKTNQPRYAVHNKNLNIDRIREYLNLSRELGFGYSESLHLNGVAGLGLPIKNKNNKVVGTLTTMTISERLPIKVAKSIVKKIKPEMDLITPPN